MGSKDQLRRMRDELRDEQRREAMSSKDQLKRMRDELRDEFKSRDISEEDIQAMVAENYMVCELRRNQASIQSFTRKALFRIGHKVTGAAFNTWQTFTRGRL